MTLQYSLPLNIHDIAYFWWNIALQCIVCLKYKKGCGYHFCFSVWWHCMCYWTSYHGSWSHCQKSNMECPYHRNLYDCYGGQLPVWPNYILSTFLQFVGRWNLIRMYVCFCLFVFTFSSRSYCGLTCCMQWSEPHVREYASL
jgi:hypothetical protein